MYQSVGTRITRPWILGLTLFLAACGGGGGNNNLPPVADAGSDQSSSVLVGDAVVLDGSASGDANGDTLGYAWSLTTLPSNSAAALSDPASAKPTFIADKAGTYVARLIVSDGRAGSAPDEVNVTVVIPAPAVAIATPVPDSIEIANPVVVAGTVDDPLAAITVNGAATPNNNGSYSTDVNLPEGGSTVTVVATNSTGADTATVNVFLKTAPDPVMGITAPQPGFTANLVWNGMAPKDIPVEVRGTIATAKGSGIPTVMVNGALATTVGAPVCPPGFICIAKEAVVSRYNFSATIQLGKGQQVIVATGADTLGGSAQAQVSGAADYCKLGSAEPGVAAERGNRQNNRCHEIDGCNRNQFGQEGSPDTVSLRNQPMPGADHNVVLVEFGAGYLPPSHPSNNFFVHGQSPARSLGCNIHDTCYQTCVPQGGGAQIAAFRACNQQQFEDHRAMCRMAYPTVICPYTGRFFDCLDWGNEKARCYRLAETYLHGVTVGGSKRYNERQADYCLP